MKPLAKLRDLVVLCSVLAGSAASAQTPVPTPSPATAEIPGNPWERTIEGFELQDRKSPPKPGNVVFLGSSSIVRWDLKASFPGANVVNRGFGGSQISDSILFAERILAAHQPRLVVFYAGDNDIGGGKSAERVREDFEKLVSIIHLRHPKTRIAFLAVKPSPARWKHIETQRKANGQIVEFIARDTRLQYVDVVTPMLNSDGQPRPELYAKDGLHLSEEGYKLWNELVRPLVRETARWSR